MKTKKQLKAMLEYWANECGLKDGPEIEDLDVSYGKFKKILKQFRIRKATTEIKVKGKYE